MDSTAIDRIGQMAIDAQQANQLDTDTPAVILNSRDGSQRIESIEHLQPGRSRYRGALVTGSIAAFTDYVNAQSNASAKAQCFVADNMKATAYFNLGDAEHPGHGDHTARLSLEPTAAYADLMKLCGNPLTQRQLHDFVEDYRDHITAIYADGQTRPLANTLAAIRDITVTTARELSTVEADMGSTRSAMESVDAKSKLTLPSAFHFKCIPYEGLAIRTFHLRLGITTGGDSLSLKLRLQQAEQTTEDIIGEYRDVLAKAVSQDATVTIGTFTP